MAGHDRTFGLTELQNVKRMAAQGDWPGLIASLQDDLVDVEDRYDRTHIAAHTIVGLLRKELPTGFVRWADEHDADPLVRLMRGAADAVRAWNIRGGALASQSSHRQLAGFKATLDLAEAHLRAAAQGMPKDPTPWVWLLHLARGQEVGPEETLGRHLELTGRAPEHFLGHYEAIASLTPSWGYHHSHMHHYAQTWAADKPAGSLLHGLIFVSNIERWRRPDQKAGPVKSDGEALALARRATELMSMEKCVRPSAFWAHNYAAGWYSLFGDRDYARAHFELLSGYKTTWPWGDLNLPYAYERLMSRLLGAKPVPRNTHGDRGKSSDLGPH